MDSAAELSVLLSCCRPEVVAAEDKTDDGDDEILLLGRAACCSSRDRLFCGRRNLYGPLAAIYDEGGQGYKLYDSVCGNTAWNGGILMGDIGRNPVMSLLVFQKREIKLKLERKRDTFQLRLLFCAGDGPGLPDLPISSSSLTSGPQKKKIKKYFHNLMMSRAV